MAVPMKAGGLGKFKIIILTMLSGMTTGIGAFFGLLLGEISPNLISVCLSFAAGAMLYIVAVELIPESRNLYRQKQSFLGYVLGIIFGVITMMI